MTIDTLRAAIDAEREHNLLIRDLPKALGADAIVTEPGFYRMTAEQYHADPCPQPSLSCSAIKTILERTPRHLFVEHPKLGAMPDGEQEEDDSTPAMVLGTVVHAMLLGAGRDWNIIAADSFRTKAARAERDAALAAGCTPILADKHARALKIATGARASIELIEGGAHALATSLPEIVAIWTEQVDLGDGTVVEIWCRSMMDLCPTEPFRGWWWIGDLKTTAEILKPQDLARKMVTDGYDIQSVFYSRGFQALVPEAIGKTAFRFWFAETSPPFLAIAAGCSGLMENSAHNKVAAGLHIFARCLSRCDWPGYPTEILRLEPPKYLEDQWREREEADPLIAGALNPHREWRNAA